MNPLVSIIIPTFNRAHLIGETLDSIIAQTYTNWECIVVDDGSTDCTDEVLAKFIEKDKRFQYHRRPADRPKGANACRNYGFEISKGGYIKWFDSDDVMNRSLFDLQLSSTDISTDCSVCKIVYYDLETKTLLNQNNIRSNNLIEDYLIGKVTFYVSGPLWRRGFLINQKYLFDEKISNLDDWDFNLRMLYNEPIIVYIDEPLIQYRIHNASLSQEIVKSNYIEILSEFRARKKHLLLLFLKRNINVSEFKIFIIKRNKFYLREALLERNTCSTALYKNLMLTLFFKMDVIGFFKICFGYYGLKYFKIGYTLFK